MGDRPEPAVERQRGAASVFFQGPQIVADGDDPFILKLLTAWRERTGCRLLLNTSFNCQEPLVNTADEARATWKRTGLDVLVTPDGIETDKSS